MAEEKWRRWLLSLAARITCGEMKLNVAIVAVSGSRHCVSYQQEVCENKAALCGEGTLSHLNGASFYACVRASFFKPPFSGCFVVFSSLVLLRSLVTLGRNCVLYVSSFDANSTLAAVVSQLPGGNLIGSEKVHLCGKLLLP